MRSTTQKLSGWGRFPIEPCRLYRPERQRDLLAILDSGREPSYVPRGLGRSYGDAALNLNGGAICHTRLNRFLSFDSGSGLLECEAGVSFAEITEHFATRGFFPPVTPGTKFVTIGGAIAADVHGKNHHRDGAISNFIADLRLLTPTGQTLTCSAAQNSDIFWATVGGMGLTGVILSARIRLRRVESAYLLVDYRKARNLDEALGIMAESDEQYEYSVAWLDGLARGESLGRSILMRGNHATAAHLPRSIRDPLGVKRSISLKAPFDFPAALLNVFTVGAFNALYYRSRRDVTRQLVDFERFFYPLDAIESWNRLYGRRGFVQYQIVLPLRSARHGLKALLERLANSRRASFLAVLKRFGQANPGLLSFPMAGYTLALDIPVNRTLVPFLHELDELVLAHEGRVYLAKDAATRPETLEAGYPRLDEFRAVKRKLDPKGLLSSSQARRLRIIEH